MDNFVLENIYHKDFESRSEKDRKYLLSIAENMNVPVENTLAIIGLDELKEVLKLATYDNFNPKSENYIINLHTHTQFSDGDATVEEILDEAQCRGKQSGKNFLIGITDHDCLTGALHTIKTVVNNPQKYDCIRVMVGAEPCFCYENFDVFKKPVPFDAIIYCLNPFEKNTIECFEKYTEKNKNYSRIIMQKVNHRWNVNASYEDSCDFHCLLKTGGSSGFFKFTRKYVEHLLDEAGICYSPIEILEIFKPFYANQNGRATLATMKIQDAIRMIEKSGFGEIGVAHPAFLELNPKFDTGWDYKSTSNIADGITYDEALKIFLTTCGLKFIELNYIYPEKYFEKFPELLHLVEVVKDTCKDLDIIASGGTDSHGSNYGEILSGRY